MTGVRGREARIRGEGVQRNYAGIEKEREFKGAYGFKEAHSVSTTVGGFVTA